MAEGGKTAERSSFKLPRRRGSFSRLVGQFSLVPPVLFELGSVIGR